jgi:hypothetical protein
LLNATTAADVGVLGYFVGQWEIHARTLRPEPSTASYHESYEWVLDGKYVRGETGRKADGSRDIVFGTYDAQADGYPFWIFSSSGSYLYLPPATWNARDKTMEWENPSGWDIVYRSRCHFPDRDNRHCTLIMKDWKGKVLLETEWRAVRRAD